MIIPILICISSFLWIVTYRVVRKHFYARSGEWACRAVTAGHAVVVTLLAALSWRLGPDPFVVPGGTNTLIQEITLIFSIGYFVFDLLWCLSYQTEGKTMLLHHLVSTIVIARVLIKGTGGTEATAGLFCMEITNPVLQARWFLRTCGLQGTLCYLVTEITFVITFIFFRLVWGTSLSYIILVHPDTDLESKLSCLLLYIISWVFVYHIFHFCVTKYMTKRKRRGGSIPITSPVQIGDRYSVNADQKPRYDLDSTLESDIGSPLAHSTSIEESPPIGTDGGVRPRATEHKKH